MKAMFETGGDALTSYWREALTGLLSPKRLSPSVSEMPFADTVPTCTASAPAMPATDSHTV